MSGNQVCQFWCFIDRETIPFPVVASLKSDVDQLTNAIKKEKDILRDLDTSDIVLWKVSLSY